MGGVPEAEYVSKSSLECHLRKVQSGMKENV